MAGREEVIKGLELCINENRDCTECPYNDGTLFCADALMHDALTLLEEREAVLLENQHKPYGFNTNANSPWISRCPRCGKKVEGKQTRFCKYCGQAVKWND